MPRGFDRAHNTVLLGIWWNMFIKFSKQIGNTFAKTINGYKGEFKTWDGFESEMELFPQVATDLRGELRILSSKM